MSSLTSKKAFREESILKALRKKRKLETREAANLLHISECTVRRIFDELEKRGEGVRIHGGLKMAQNSCAEYHFENLQLRQSEEKQRIGEYACRLVENGDILFLDSGTTIQQMAFFLAQRLKNKELHDVQVFTNSLRNLNILMECCDVNLIGGLFRSKRQDFCGYLSEMMLEAISFEKCFLSADGICANSNDGIMATDIFTAKINQIVSRRASSVYLLADATKFVRRSFIKYTSIENVKMIITDSGLPDSMVESLKNLGPEVIKT